MSREDLHFKLRLPAEMKLLLEESAAASKRSLTAEILARLAASFESQAGSPAREEGLYILLDTAGRPISWDEVREIAAALKLAGKYNPTSLRYEVITPDMEASSRRQKEVAELARYLRSAGKPAKLRPVAGTTDPMDAPEAWEADDRQIPPAEPAPSPQPATPPKRGRRINLRKLK